jgi:hypothetical protein
MQSTIEVLKISNIAVKIGVMVPTAVVGLQIR